MSRGVHKSPTDRTPIDIARGWIWPHSLNADCTKSNRYSIWQNVTTWRTTTRDKMSRHNKMRHSISETWNQKNSTDTKAARHKKAKATKRRLDASKTRRRIQNANIPDSKQNTGTKTEGQIRPDKVRNGRERGHHFGAHPIRERGCHFIHCKKSQFAPTEGTGYTLPGPNGNSP